MATHDSANHQHKHAFATTHWSVVLKAGEGSSADSKQALATLCEAYWHPLYAYVCRRTTDRNEAQDLTQAFFSELLAKNYVRSASPERGRFRSFLLTAMKHFLSKEWEKARAQKRGGRDATISLDFATADSSLRIEPASGLTAEELYDQQWAITLLGRIMDRLEREFSAKSAQFVALKGFLIGDNAHATYASAARTLGISEVAARKAVSRMRGRYRELLRDEIARTVSAPDDVDEEIKSLFAALGS